MSTNIGLVVVTHRSAASLPDLVASLAAHEPSVTLAVVDSGSPEGPPQVEGADLVVLDNVGFGRACNEGTRHAEGAEVLAFLNPDVRLAGPSLTQLAEGVAARPRVGVATGPVVDEHGNRQPSAWGPTSPARALWFGTGWRLPRVRRLVGGLRRGGTGSTSMAHDDVLVDGHVLGGAMVVRRECWEQLGGFDEDFFLYWEDADLCQRARDAGWEVRVLPCTPIVHVAGTSSEDVTDEQRWAWYLEGADRFGHKHLTDAQRRRLLRALRVGHAIGRLTGRR